MASGDGDDFHLSRSFFMGRKYPADNKMIFYKKLANPINLDKWKCLSFFSLRGFRYWHSSFFRQLLDNSYNKLDFAVFIKIGENTFTVAISPIVITHGHLVDAVSLTVDLLKKFVANFNEKIIFQTYGAGIIFFKILEKNIDVKFSNVLCDFFGFQKNQIYNHKSDRHIFYPQNTFRNVSCDHIGISINFGFNELIPGNEIITILSCDDVSFSNFFHKNLIQRPQKMNLKFVNIHEIEIRFIDLSNGQVLSSVCNPKSEEIHVDLSFSQI